jgi:hypothetical protein
MPRGGQGGTYREGHKIPGRALCREPVPGLPVEVEYRIDLTDGVFHALVLGDVLSNASLPRLRERAAAHALAVAGLVWERAIVIACDGTGYREKEIAAGGGITARVGFSATRAEIALEPPDARGARHWRRREWGTDGPGARWFHPMHGWVGTKGGMPRREWEGGSAVLPYDDATWATLTALAANLQAAWATLDGLVKMPPADLSAILATGSMRLLTTTPESP